MTQAGDGTGAAPVPVPVRRVLLATLLPAALTFTVILLSALLLRGLVQRGAGADRGDAVVAAAVGLLALAASALTAVVSAAVAFPLLLPRGTRLRALAGYLAAALFVAFVSTAGLWPTLAAVPLLSILPLVLLGRLRWWWAAGPAVLAVTVALVTAAAG